MTRKRTVAVTLLILCCFSGHNLIGSVVGDAPAENTTAETPATAAKSEKYVSRFFKDEAEMWLSPFHLKAKDVLVWGAILAGTGVMIANDEAIYRNFKRYQNTHPWVDRISPKITLLGDWSVACGIAGLFFLNGTIFKDKKARDTGLMAWETLLHTGFLIQVIKHLAGRQRPEVENGLDYWHGPAAFFRRYSEGYYSNYDSFPSGHTITVWGLATVIAENYKNHFWVPVACYGLATLTGLSRVTEDKHWFSDVFLGAALGFTIGKMVVRNQNRRLQLTPAVTPGGMGLSLSYEIK